MLGLLLISGCAESASSAPNVLLISVDTLRADHLGCYGYPRETSPHIDALAGRGAVFGQAVSPCSWTLPSHASLLTGRYPSQHGLQDDGVTLSSSVPTLAEAFAAAGHHTLAVVSHVYVSSAFGLDRGFDQFDDSLLDGGTRNPIAAEVVDRFVETLDRAPDEPFFGFVHFYDPHWDYAAPEPHGHRFTDPDYRGAMDGSYAAMRAYDQPRATLDGPDMAQLIALYDGEIAYLDAQLGRLFAELDERGRLANTIVAITADHGEEFKEHGFLGHGKSLFAEQLRVPLVIAGHGAFPAGQRRDEPVSSVDLVPTLLELAGAEPLRGQQGRSLVRRGGSDRAVFAESIRSGVDLRAVRLGRYKLIDMPASSERLYYDIGSDPREQRPLAEDPTGGALEAALDAFVTTADRGWHLKMLALRNERLVCKGTLSTTGRFVETRHYHSDRIGGSNVNVRRFELSDDGRTLHLDFVVRNLMASVNVQTEPPDAELTLDLQVTGASGEAGLFLGAGERADAGAPLTFGREDPRLVGMPDHRKAAPGAYLRAAPLLGEASELPEDVREHLRALGYLGGTGER